MQKKSSTVILARKAIKGNAKAYGELIEMYKEYLYRTAYLYTKNEQSALDAVGDCILKGFQSIKSLKNPAYFKTWITRILFNAVKDSFKSNENIVFVYEVEKFAYEPGFSMEEKWDLFNAYENK